MTSSGSFLLSRPVTGTRQRSDELVNVGTVGILNCHGCFLESHDNGELHASKTVRGDAESWILWQIDWSRRSYALQNVRTKLFLSKKHVKCVTATMREVGVTERWTFISGNPHQVWGRIALRAYDGTILGSDAPGRCTGCGGEVMAADRPDPSVGAKYELWPGWFSLMTDRRVVVVDKGLAVAL